MSTAGKPQVERGELTTPGLTQLGALSPAVGFHCVTQRGPGGTCVCPPHGAEGRTGLPRGTGKGLCTPGWLLGPTGGLSVAVPCPRTPRSHLLLLAPSPAAAAGVPQARSDPQTLSPCPPSGPSSPHSGSATGMLHFPLLHTFPASTGLRCCRPPSLQHLLLLRGILSPF